MCAISILPSPSAIAFHTVSLLLNVDRKAVCLPLTAIEARLNEARQSKANESYVCLVADQLARAREHVQFAFCMTVR